MHLKNEMLEGTYVQKDIYVHSDVLLAFGILIQYAFVQILPF